MVIGAKPKADRPVNLGVPGAQHDHRHIRPAAQALAHLGAARTGKHEVKQHQVSTSAVERIQRVRPVGQTATSKPSLRSK
jgi:hypothetical protein